MCKTAECLHVIAIRVSVAAVICVSAASFDCVADGSVAELTYEYFASTARSRLVPVPNISQVQRNIKWFYCESSNALGRFSDIPTLWDQA